MNISGIEAKLRSLGLDEKALQSLTQSTPREPQRPGTIEGNHFFDLGDSFLWRAGVDGDKCGEDEWFLPAKKNGDTAQRMDTCPSSLDWYRIYLVA